RARRDFADRRGVRDSAAVADEGRGADATGARDRADGPRSRVELRSALIDDALEFPALRARQGAGRREGDEERAAYALAQPILRTTAQLMDMRELVGEAVGPGGAQEGFAHLDLD